MNKQPTVYMEFEKGNSICHIFHNQDKDNLWNKGGSYPRSRTGIVPLLKVTAKSETLDIINQSKQIKTAKMSSIYEIGVFDLITFIKKESQTINVYLYPQYWDYEGMNHTEPQFYGHEWSDINICENQLSIF